MSYGERTSEEMERVATLALDAAFAVHRKFGPGLLESPYEVCLAYEIAKRGLTVLRQVRVPIAYDGVKLDEAFRIDLLVEDCVIVEVKSVEKLIPLYKAQCLTYLKLSGKRLCILINFNVELLKDGIRRIVR